MTITKIDQTNQLCLNLSSLFMTVRRKTLSHYSNYSVKLGQMRWKCIKILFH